MSASATVSPFLAGITCRCARYSRGKLFAGFLTIAPHCSVCGLAYAFADSGDGPATVILCLALLRPFKATMVALQFHHRAGEGRSQ